MPMQDRKVVHADIKPENPPERAAHFIDVPKMPWETTKFPGIRIKVLYTDDTGVTTALFKLDPGAVVPLHEHTWRSNCPGTPIRFRRRPSSRPYGSRR
jgi:hypothetical protein